MAAARTDVIIRGREIFLAVAKPGQSGQPVFTPFGCMSKFDETLSKETLEISCRSMVGKVGSGKDAESTITIDGFYFIYASGDVASNVSYNELRGYINGPALSYKFGTPAGGDPVYARNYILKELKLTGDNDGLATYSATLESAGAETVANNPTT